MLEFVVLEMDTRDRFQYNAILRGSCWQYAFFMQFLQQKSNVLIQTGHRQNKDEKKEPNW